VPRKSEDFFLLSQRIVFYYVWMFVSLFDVGSITVSL